MEDFKSIYEELDAKARKDIGKPLVSVMIDVGVTLAALWRAHRNAKKGNYPAAIYNLLMWHSFKQGQHSELLLHNIKITHPGTSNAAAASAVVRELRRYNKGKSR